MLIRGLTHLPPCLANNRQSRAAGGGALREKETVQQNPPARSGCGSARVLNDGEAEPGRLAQT